MAFYGNLSGHVVPESEMRLNYTDGVLKSVRLGGCYMSLSGGFS